MSTNDDSTPSPAKACTKCGAVKALSEFYASKRARDGRQSECRGCVSLRAKAYRAANRERLNAYDAARYAANAEERCRKQRAWYAANRDHVLAWRAAYRASHAEECRAAVIAWRAANPERAKANQARWRAANSDRRYANNARRRALLRGAPVRDQIRKSDVWERDRGICHLCGKRANPRDWHLDHLLPLSCGGDHSMNNVAVSHPSCNLRKKNTGPSQLRLGVGE